MITSSHILFLNSALLAVVSIRHAGAATDGAPPLVGPVVTLITDSHKSARAHVRVTHHTFPITCAAGRNEKK